MATGRARVTAALVALALVAVIGHLATRAATLDRAANHPLAAVTWGIEAVWLLGVLGVAAVLRRPTGVTPRRTVPHDEAAVLVRVGRRPDPDALRSTLLALATLPRNRRTVVADASGNGEIESLALAHGAQYHSTSPGDRLGTEAPIDPAVRWVCILDAGDIPAMELVDALTSMAATSFEIGVVQGAVRSVSERGVLDPDRLREPLLTAGCLNAALGATGAAMWRGSGAVFSRAAWDDLGRLPRRHRRSETSASVALRARGWVLLAPALPVLVAASGVVRPRQRAARLRRLCLDAIGAIPSLVAGSARSAAFRRTLPSAAWLVAHTGPGRLLAALAIGVASCSAGASPVVVTPAVVVSTAVCWSALTLATTIGRRDAVRFGDGARRVLSAVLGGLAAVLLLGREPRRAAPRVPVDLAGSISGLPATVVDLTAGGAGLVVPQPIEVGMQTTFVVSLPRVDGRRVGVVSRAVVRHALPDPQAGGVRVGIELVDVPADAREALTEFCRVSFPRRLLRALPADARETSPSVLPELSAAGADDR